MSAAKLNSVLAFCLAAFLIQAHTPLPEVRAQDFVPAAVTISTDRVKVDGKLYYSHVVEENQTLYSIGKAYGVNGLDIIDCNPKLNLDSRSIRVGDVLLIPFVERAVPEVAENVLPEQPEPQPESVLPTLDTAILQTTIQDSTLIAQESVSDTLAVTDTIPAGFVFEPVEKVKLALLLPFDADTIANAHYMDFYMGALLAVRDLSFAGVKIDMEVFDVTSPAERAKAQNAIGQADVVIGPVSSYDIRSMLPYLPKDRYIVSPIDPRTESLAQHFPVILAATPSSYQVDDAVEWMFSEMAPKDTIIIARESGVSVSGNAAYLLGRIAADSLGRKSAGIDYALSEGVAVGELFSAHMPQEGTARVVAASDREVFTGDVIRNVALQNYLGNKAVIYGPAKTKAADVDQMCGAFLRQSVTYYIDYDRPEVISFVNDYRALYSGEPDNFAFHGYDTVKYFVSICNTYGSGWASVLPLYDMSGLQTSFRFKESGKGFVNSAVRRVSYASPFTITMRP